MRLFQARLEDYLEEIPVPSYDSLVQAFGAPEELAMTLLSAVSSKEQTTYACFSKAVQIVQYVAIAALVLLTAYVLLNPLNIRIVDVVRKDFYTNTYWPR